MRLPRFHLVTCEHGGNRIPARYAALFHDAGPLLRSHRGYDRGALRMARALARILAAPLQASTISRLLIDLNRSPDRPDLYSEFTRNLPQDVRDEIFECCYRSYRTRVETAVAQARAAGKDVLHVSCHSFTPVLDGEVRTVDVGLLYDPARANEAALCRAWRAALRQRMPRLRVRMNEPYAGIADGLTTTLRARHSDGYAGIELEINQKLMRSPQAWAALRLAIAHALAAALAETQ